MENVFFFLGGEVNWTGASTVGRRRWQNVWEELPNLYAHLQCLPEEIMNSVVAVSDILFAGYRDFPNSSNALTKAAVFERPILVSDGHLMGERVRNFGLGEVVPEGDVGEIAAALERMSAPSYLEALRRRAKWAEYREAHSMARLTQVMRSLLEGSLS
jgi:hypothetical protein